MNPRRKCRRCLSALPLVATQPGPAPSLIAVPLVRSSKLQVVSCHKTTSPSTIPSHQPSTVVLLPRVPFCFTASLLCCFVVSTHNRSVDSLPPATVCVAANSPTVVRPTETVQQQCNRVRVSETACHVSGSFGVCVCVCTFRLLYILCTPKRTEWIYHT